MPSSRTATTPFGSVGATIQDNILYLFKNIYRYITIKYRSSRIHNPHIHSLLYGMVKEHSVHGFTDIIVTTERERKVIFEITGDGLTAEEVGRIRQVIRHLNYKRGRRKAPRLFYRYNFTKRKEI